MTDVCEKCGKVVAIGDYPFCPHGKQEIRHHGFTPGYSEGLDRHFDTLHDKVRHMDRNNIVPAKLKTTTKGSDRVFVDYGRR